ncbi:CoA-binding protein [Iodobacter sp. CM08]|uniref:CoA-binding protein n=1 Tax=Iodobacter sp. CM08 TaxID=3085902 RepID=UPI0029821441|nr:CoA-binding protein [Iodobacter sp. CM08]MDW5415071.1 CoA-binding protein [Iodobacter sp. CM08]
MSFQNPSDDEIREFLLNIHHIAVVGLSPKPDRPSFGVSTIMQKAGFHIIPVRPYTESVLGETAYASLSDIPGKVDLVNVFRASDQIDAIVDEAIQLQIPAIWIQLGIINEAAALRAKAAGLFVVMNRCIKIEYLQLCL